MHLPTSRGGSKRPSHARKSSALPAMSSSCSRRRRIYAAPTAAGRPARISQRPASESRWLDGLAAPASRTRRWPGPASLQAATLTWQCLSARQAPGAQTNPHSGGERAGSAWSAGGARGLRKAASPPFPRRKLPSRPCARSHSMPPTTRPRSEVKKFRRANPRKGSPHPSSPSWRKASHPGAALGMAPAWPPRQLDSRVIAYRGANPIPASRSASIRDALPSVRLCRAKARDLPPQGRKANSHAAAPAAQPRGAGSAVKSLEELGQLPAGSVSWPADPRPRHSPLIEARKLARRRESSGADAWRPPSRAGGLGVRFSLWGLHRRLLCARRHRISFARSRQLQLTRCVLSTWPLSRSTPPPWVALERASGRVFREGSAMHARAGR